jgi:DNA helicase-2/ATP-dependent DNA helicase PcrA
MTEYSLENSSDNNSWHARLRRELNPEQYFFVTHRNSSLLGIAGPGSGKTRALTFRVANLLKEKVPPENILLVTFTNKAAEEMKNRVREIIGYLPPGLWAGTFHSVGARILRRHASLVNRGANFSILDEDDRGAMIKSSLSSLKLNLKSKDQNLFIKRGLLGKILSSARNSALDLETYVDNQMPDLSNYLPIFKKVEEMYEEKKRLANAFDFDDLLSAWLELLRENENIRQRYQEQFKHILVDEYQDTNAIQDQLVLLLGEKSSTCLVGDDAQSIYSFRCAEIGNILTFPLKRPDCTIVKLVQNYRSVPEILELANCSISKNKQQIDKELFTVRETGEKPWVYVAPDNFREAHFIVNKVQEFYDEGQNLSDIAVLYRSSYLAQDVELELLKRNIPYLTFGGLKFLQRAHIKDILAWLKILENPRDEISWQRVVLMHEGLGEATFQELWRKMRSYPQPLQAVIQEKIIPPRGLKGWKALVETLRQLENAVLENVPRLIKIIIESHYREYLKEKYPDDFAERSMGIERLAAYGSRCSSLQEFLESLILEDTLIMEDLKDENLEKDFLTLSTIHSAKGKEWKTVLLIGLNEGRFPTSQGIKNIEEERRLFYVAVTRAKDYLYLTSSQEEYRGWGSYLSGPSSFIRELPLHCYQVLFEE